MKKSIEVNNYGRDINLETDDHIVDVYIDCHSGNLMTEQDTTNYIYYYEDTGEIAPAIITHIERLEYEKAIWVKKYFLLKKQLIEMQQELEKCGKME